MIINLKTIFITLITILFTFILYSFSTEIYLIIFLNIAMLIRIIHRKFYALHVWSEWTLIIIKVVLLLFFHFRGFLGDNPIYFISYYMIQILLTLSVLESLYYLYKTYKLRKDDIAKIKNDNVSFKFKNSDNNIIIYDDIENVNFNVNKKRLDRHKIEKNVDINLSKPKIIDFHGMKVKVLTEEQKQSYLKEIRKKHKTQNSIIEEDWDLR